MKNNKQKEYFKAYNLKKIIGTDDAEEAQQVIEGFNKTIEELKCTCHLIEESIKYKELNQKVNMVMNKWVKVPNYNWYDEKDKPIFGYRYMKIVGVESYEGYDSFDMKVENVFYIPNNSLSYEYIGNDKKYKIYELSKSENCIKKDSKQNLGKNKSQCKQKY